MIAILQALQKWDYEAHEYRQFFVPASWNVKLYSCDMDEIVNCPHCGRMLHYGETYVSLEIHNQVGFGYGVCEECYKHEWQRRRLHKEQEE